jgi:hypothetical protein
MEGFVGLFNLLDPHVQGIKFFFNQIVEVIGSVEDTVNSTHKEREERQTHEFQNDGEYVLIGRSTREITIAYCCNDLEDPIESENVLGVFELTIEIVSEDPRLDAIFR